MLLRVECGIMRETLVLMETGGGEGKTHETYGGRKFIPSNPRGVHVARQVHAPCVEKLPSHDDFFDKDGLQVLSTHLHLVD